jgi:hypothetical protein
MKTIQEELGGVSQRKKWTCKVKTKKWDEKTQNILKELSKCVDES